MSDFQPKSEKEISEQKLFEPGEYDFDVMKADKTISENSGNAMIKAQLLVYVGARTYYLTCYLTGSEKMQYLLRHFCDTLGILDAYETGQLSAIAQAARGKSGKGKFVIQPSKDPNYPDKNAARDFVKREAGDTEPREAKARIVDETKMPPAEFEDSDLPF